MIYFVRSGDLVKIGYASSVEKRIPTLRTSNPNAIVVLGAMTGDMEAERALHERFAKHRVRGEWFVLCDEIVGFIQENARPYLYSARKLGLMPPVSELNPPFWLLALTVGLMAAWLPTFFWDLFGNAPVAVNLIAWLAPIIIVPLLVVTVSVRAYRGISAGLAELRYQRAVDLSSK